MPTRFVVTALRGGSCLLLALAALLASPSLAASGDVAVVALLMNQAGAGPPPYERVRDLDDDHDDADHEDDEGKDPPARGPPLAYPGPSYVAPTALPPNPGRYPFVADGLYDVYPLGQPNFVAGNFVIKAYCPYIIVQGIGQNWTGQGQINGAAGFYNWRFSNGASGRTDLTVNSDGSLQGHVIGAGLNWWYVARLH